MIVKRKGAKPSAKTAPTKKLPPATHRPAESWPPAGMIEVITFHAHQSVKDSLGEPAYHVSATRSMAISHRRLGDLLFSLDYLDNKGFTAKTGKIAVRGFCGSEFAQFYHIPGTALRKLVVEVPESANERDFFFRLADDVDIILRVKDADQFLKFVTTAQFERIALTAGARRVVESRKRKIDIPDTPEAEEDIIDTISKGKAKL